MLATLNQMHEERFADDDAGMSDHAREASGANERPAQPEEGERWIADARREASRRKSSRAFIDKHPTLAVAGPYEGHSDEVLFRRYQDGEDAAFIAIYERYKASIYAYCAQAILSAGLSREFVDDTFQDIFLRLVQYRNTFTGGEFKAWIFTVTRHSCLSTKKRAFRQKLGMESVGDGENFDENVSAEVRSAFATTDDPLERMSKEEQTALLVEAIAKLPEEFREALLLSEYEGMTYDEIGKLTGASLSTIRIRIYRAKARLRKMLLPVIGDEVDRLLPKPDDEDDRS
jgi:RNA polymerase sigma-70 factor (ECF subfamily)